MAEMILFLGLMAGIYMAWNIGANDIANGMASPVAAKAITQTTEVPIFLLAGGGLFIAIGVFTWGYRVIETIGHKITVLNNTRGFSVDFGTATSVLIASKLGLPVSTTHAAVGAVIGVGLAGGLAAVDFKMVWKITLYWVITLPLAALPTKLLDDLLLMIEKVIDVLKSVHPLVEAADNYFQNFSENQRNQVKQAIRLIREYEFQSDQVERKLLSDILSYPFVNATSAYHLAELIRDLGDISNHAENAADMMRAMIAR